VAETREAGDEAATGAAPMYDIAPTLPARGAMSELMLRYIDRINEVDNSQP
jgi:hypothetical protein